MSLSRAPRWSLQVVVVCLVMMTGCFSTDINRVLTPTTTNSELLMQNVTMVINCTNDDVPPGLRNNKHVLFYLHSCGTNVNSLCPEDKENSNVLGILGEQINMTSGRPNHWGWVAKEGFPHYMLVHLTLPLAEIAHCFSCHKLYNYPFPADAEWYNTSDVCVSHGRDPLQLSGRISSRALSITLSNPKQVVFLERPNGECSVERSVQQNTVLLVVVIVFIVVIAVGIVAGVVYRVCWRKRTRRSPSARVTRVPLYDTESQLRRGDTEDGKSINEMESQRPVLETIEEEEEDNRRNTFFSLHGEPILDDSIRYSVRLSGLPETG
ncbi:uncharacterized protein LOC112559195 [Pomacea canaliculata]|uniref:uncharacterized protein LOC112559195 n=1 Tax=Pomacea canaliculata TaxID=400727 RepID=UPI000D72C416|nr:uncharacterized protein LOC112559195 [Pomacea canaliculata]